MGPKTRRVLRRQGFRLEPLAVVSLRIQPEIWERCDWAATAKGVNRQEWVRDTLASASRDAKPPQPRCFRGLHVSGAELDAWEQVAARRGHTLDSLIRKIFNNAAAKDAAEKSS
jgi:hypothetical protein